MITLYRALPTLVAAEEQPDGSYLVHRHGGGTTRISAAELAAGYEPARAQDLEAAFHSNGGGPGRAKPGRHFAGRRAQRVPAPKAAARGGRTNLPPPEVLARARAMWDKHAGVVEIAKAAAAMGRKVKPAAIYGWAERYGWGNRKGAEKKTASVKGAGG